MGTAKRERQKANRAKRIEEAQVEAEQGDQKRRIFIVVGLVVAALLAALLYSIIAGGDDDNDTGAVETGATETELMEADENDGAAAGNNDDDGATATTAAPTTVAGESLPADLIAAPEPGEAITGETPCPGADYSGERVSTFENAPPMCIDPAKSYTAVMNTTKGSLTIELDASKAPKTVNNFVVLARYGYYDGVPFHRVIPGFVAQVGDANPRGGQLGTGGPGYKFEDELPASLDEYQLGSLAMANSGPDTNGSQIFILEGSLPTPAYSLFGQVTDGLDTTFPALMAAGTASGSPTEAMFIDSIDVTES